MAAAGEQLIKAGIPLWRLAYFQLTLHPGLDGHAYYWRRGQQVQVQSAPAGLRKRSEFRDNPMAIVYDQLKTVRVRLESVEPTARALPHAQGYRRTPEHLQPVLERDDRRRNRRTSELRDQPKSPRGIRAQSVLVPV